MVSVSQHPSVHRAVFFLDALDYSFPSHSWFLCGLFNQVSRAPSSSSSLLFQLFFLTPISLLTGALQGDPSKGIRAKEVIRLGSGD